MGEVFFNLFKKDDNPVYKACVAVILYEMLQDCWLIPRGDAVFRERCARHGKKIPDEDSPSAGTKKHCAYLKYIFVYNYYENTFKKNSWEDRWIRTLCRTAACTAASNPDEVYEKLKTEKGYCKLERKLLDTPLSNDTKIK